MRPTARRVGAMIGVLLLALACGGAPEVELRLNEMAPSLELPRLDGDRLSLESLRGTPVVLVFWATWCLPCLDEMPLLAEVEASGRARVVSVALDDGGREVLERFTAARPVPYPVLIGNQEVFRRYDGLTIPYTLIVDRGGRVDAVHRGRLERETLWQELERAAE